MKLMVGPDAPGGMRSVIERYVGDGFVAEQDIRIIWSYRPGRFWRRHGAFVRALAQFFWVLATRRVELVHLHAAAHGSFWRKAAFANAARCFGVPVLLHLHGSTMREFYAGLRPWLKTRVAAELRRATRVLVLSESWRDFVASIEPRARIEIAPNHVALGDKSSGGASALNVLFLGRVGARKGVGDLIAAFAHAQQIAPEARLIIAGDGDRRDARRRILAYSLSSCASLVGWIDGAEKEKLLRQADIFVLPSYREGMSVAVLEAMARGVAVITTRVGASPDMIADGLNGVLIEPGDVTALAAAIVRLGLDDDERRRMGCAARERVATYFAAATALPKLRAIYQAVARR